MHDRPFNWEEDDADPSTYDYDTARRMFGWPQGPFKDEWEQDPRINCALCESRVRMPGHDLCSYCHHVGLSAHASTGINGLEHLLTKYVDWSVYQATHPTEGEAHA